MTIQNDPNHVRITEARSGGNRTLTLSEFDGYSEEGFIAGVENRSLFSSTNQTTYLTYEDAIIVRDKLTQLINLEQGKRFAKREQEYAEWDKRVADAEIGSTIHSGATARDYVKTGPNKWVETGDNIVNIRRNDNFGWRPQWVENLFTLIER